MYIRNLIVCMNSVAINYREIREKNNKHNI